MNVYIAKDGERLDQIVVQNYGNTTYTKEVLKHNIHLKSKIILESGDKIVLPKIEKKISTLKSKALW